MGVPLSLKKAIKEELVRSTGHPFAVFDFDNTCIVNDIGEATFAHLCRNKLLKDPSLLSDTDDSVEYHERVFHTYHDLCKNGDIKGAYTLYARAFSGFTPEEAHQATVAAINAEADELGTKEVYGRTIAHGLTLNANAVALFNFVKDLGIAAWVVSASNEISVLAAMKHFGLEAQMLQ